MSELPPPPPPPGYGTPGFGAPVPGPYGYGYPTPAKTNGFAIAALICGIGSFVVCGLAAIAGIPLGIVALRQIRESEGTQQGRGLALAGIWVSVGYLAIALLAVIAFVVLFLVVEPSDDTYDYEPIFPTTSTVFELPTTTSTSTPR